MGNDLITAGGFYTFATISVAMCAVVVFARNILHALTAMAMAMVAVAGLYFMLSAEFLGVAQLIVYGGAVVALYAFAMMLFDSKMLITERAQNGFFAGFIATAITACLVIAFVELPLNAPSTAPDSTKKLGISLFTNFVAGFEIVGVLLLVALVAGIALTKKMGAEK